MYTSLYEDDGETEEVPTLTQNIIDSNNKFLITYVNKTLDYSGKLATEKNAIPGYGYTVSIMKDLVLGNDYFRFQYQNNNGGAGTQEVPVQIIENNIRIGKGYTMSENTMVSPYAQFGWYEWKRSLNPVEIYDHNYMGPGIVLNYALTPTIVLKIDEFLGWTHGANLEVVNAFSAALGSSAINKLGVSLDYTVTDKVHANVGWEYTNFKYTPLAITVTGGETRNSIESTNLSALTAGLSYTF